MWPLVLHEHCHRNDACNVSNVMIVLQIRIKDGDLLKQKQIYDRQFTQQQEQYRRLAEEVRMVFVRLKQYALINGRER